jgi:hypothetical protein
MSQQCLPVAVEAAALTIDLCLFPTLANLLDMLFGHLATKVTKPIIANRGLRHRMVA